MSGSGAGLDISVGNAQINPKSRAWPMKILFVADLHQRQDWFEWVARQSTRYEMLAIAGDLQDAFSDTSMHDQARTISEWLCALRTPTVVCSGNHDYWVQDPRCSIDVDAEAAWLRRLRGRGNIVGVDRDCFDINGLCVAVNGWLQVPRFLGRADVLVTHSPPAGCDCAICDDDQDTGDAEICSALDVYPPRLLLAGHVHKPASLYGYWPMAREGSTLVLVPGFDDTLPSPAHWAIDTEIREARHSNGATVVF